MAIKKMDSQAFNDLLDQTQDKILTMNSNISDIKDDMTTKLKVIDYEINYLNKSVSALSTAAAQDGEYILLDNNNHGLYSTYCNNVHPYFKVDPINIFNVKPINSSDIFYKDEANVSINGVQNDYYNNILKDDTVSSKSIFFEEYAKVSTITTDTSGASYLGGDNTITLSVLIDQQKAYGINKFNIIEIDPYLMGSFNITSINVYTSNTSTPAKTVSAINSVGKTRIILDQKYLFYKVDFIIEPQYSVINNGSEIIPFGLKHLYFYEADFRNDSYIDLTYESDSYLDYVNNKVDIYTPTGMIDHSN